MYRLSPLDLRTVWSFVTIISSIPSRRSSSSIPSPGPSTRTAVDKASAAIADGATKPVQRLTREASSPEKIGPGGSDLLLTRSFSNRLRIHLNGGYVLASEVDGDDYWRGGIAFDIPVGFSSRLIMGDLYTEIPADTGPTRTWAELGTRVQITNLTVIDMGLATRLDEWNRGVANVRLVVGFSRVFGIGGLVRVPEYPNPRIR